MFSDALIRNMTFQEKCQYVEELPVTLLRETFLELVKINDQLREEIKHLEAEHDTNEAEIKRLEDLSETHQVNPEAA